MNFRRELARIRGLFPRTAAGRWRAAASLLALGIVGGMIGIVVGPALRDRRLLGSHDWDQMEAHRYLIYKSVRFYHQFPFWNPYGCGGHPSWAGIESGTAIVSPWLPFYLFAPLPIAIKVELVGTAALSAIGTWLFAGRFTRSAALRAFACAVFVVNGRWALQAAAGHTWHLYYAWTPWVLYFFDRAHGLGRLDHLDDRPPPRWRDVVLCGAFLAMMVYNGAIYPLPQTIVALAIWACGLAIYHRRLRPISVALVSGVVAFCLAAPKLVPLLDELRRFPRLVKSTETLDLHGFIVLLTSHDQGLDSRPAPLDPYGWHEWGMYIGWAAFLALVAGAIFARGPREIPLKWVGMLMLLLGFGAFHEYAPWTELHKFPIFRSQHVPSRWLYPATLALAAVLVSMLERRLRRLGRARPLAEVILLAAVAGISFDIAMVAHRPMAQGFGAHMPKVALGTAEFHTEAHVSAEYGYDGGGYAPPSLPAEIANVGEIDCGMFPGLNTYLRDAHGAIPGLGAKGQGDPAYRGEAYTASGAGRATIAHFSPNEITVKVEDGTPGDTVVLNQNWDAGWRADGAPSIAYHDAVATLIRAPNETIVFRYRPHFWGLSLAIFSFAVGGIVWTYVRRRGRALSSPGALGFRIRRGYAASRR